MQATKRLFFIFTAGLIFLVTACKSSSLPPTQESAQTSLNDCEKAMEIAASISNIEDTIEDIDPAISACKSIDEFTLASSKYPAALDGADVATFVSNRCTSNLSLKSTPICSSLLPTVTTIHYLAVSSGTPAPNDPVPVSDQATMQSLIVAAQSQDREKYNSIAASSSVALIPGGSIVDIISTSGELVQIRLSSRDIKGNDLSGQVRWTYSDFIQSRQM